MAINWKRIGATIRRMGEPEQMRRDVPDDVTTDKRLRSLRRERRVQLESVEKEHLKRQILDFQKGEQRRWVVDERPLLNEGVKRVPQKKVVQSYLGRR